MDKIDAAVIAKLKGSNIAGGVVKALEREEYTYGIVRVNNPIYLCRIERRFDVVGVYPFISSVAVRLGLKEAIGLARMQEVEYVSGESAVFAFDAQNGDFSHTGTQNQKILPARDTRNAGADGNNKKDDADGVKIPEEQTRSERSSALKVESDLDGRGVTLCVMDTGISPHLDLSVPRDRVVHFEDVIAGERLPYDDNGHGTFVAGVAAGNGNLSARGTVGVAPMANIVGLKAIGSSGESGVLKILDGMQWLFDNFRQFGIRVVCMSFGAEPQAVADPLKMGAEMLARSGLIVVAAAGNSGNNSVKSPAISPEVIAVGAVDGSNAIATFSSRGVYGGVYRPDVYADGVNVKSVDAGGTYTHMSGTSAAAPYVAGACCLLCQKYRRITPSEAKRAILASTVNVGGARILRL